MQARIADSDGKKNCTDILVDFYIDLGWTPATHDVDSVYVKMNPVDQIAFYDNMAKLTTPDIDSLAINLMLLIKGPSADENVPQGKVWLQEGWLIERPESGQTP